MYPNIYQKVSGAFPDFYPFGGAPISAPLPYATHQLVGGSSENYLKCTSDMDEFSVQIDVWDKTASGVLSAASTIRNALEPEYYLYYMGGSIRDTETKLYRYTMRFDVLEAR